jgi:hypothetical protein
MCFWLHKAWWTVREESLDSPRGADGPRVGDGWSVIEGAVLVVQELFFGWSTVAPRTVRLGHTDGPPGACGRSSWCCAVLLSPLLLEFRFRFGIVWSLFLGLEVRRDYATLANSCGDSWLWIWGIGSVLSLENNFYRVPFTPPLFVA